MDALHPYGELLVRTDAGRWYWDHILWDAVFIPRGRRTPVCHIHLSEGGNTELGALCAIVRALTERPGGVS